MKVLVKKLLKNISDMSTVVCITQVGGRCANGGHRWPLLAFRHFYSFKCFSSSINSILYCSHFMKSTQEKVLLSGN